MKLISGSLGGRILKTIEAKGYRPAMGKVREALFSILESQGIEWDSVKVLDVYAGTGSLAFESISRGAKHASFIELDKEALKCLHYNAKNLKIDDRCSIYGEDASKFLARDNANPFNIIFVDPPYGEKMFIPTLERIVQNNWLAKDGYLIAEVEAGLKFSCDRQNEGLDLVIDRDYGQTRILIWQNIN